MAETYRPRATRTAVAVPCRMNLDGTWSDGFIHNASDHGLMLSAGDAPAVGRYLEVRRGTIIIIGRVVWSRGKRFGVRTQDAITAGALANEPVLARKPTVVQSGEDRRASDRVAAKHDLVSRTNRSHRAASNLQYICIAIAGIAAAIFAAMQVYSVLNKPLAKVASLLGGPQV